MLARLTRPFSPSLRAGLVAAAIALLSACGGGGGGGGERGSGASGFVPAPGTLGATLYARGTDVRPVRAWAKWLYHSHDYDLGLSSDYSVTAQAGATPNQVLETTSDDPGTAATTVTADADGSVRVSAPVSFGGAPLFTIAGFEVRSPVRVNDQYVLFDGAVANIDADGDGKSDDIKVAYWRKVVGNEPVTLPNRAAPVVALRIDSFVVVEVQPSSGGDDVRVELMTSDWYEPGVGLVRVTIPGSVPGRAYDLEDLLTGWDGVTEGRGYITQPEQLVGASPSTAMGAAQSAVGMPDGALVATGTGLHRLDRNGLLVATLPSPPLFLGYRLVRSSAGIQALAGIWPAMQLHAFDAQGQYLAMTGSFDFSSGRPNTVYDIGQSFGSHPGNPYLWVAWSRLYQSPFGVFHDEVVLRAVAPDGSSPFPELTFPATSQANFIRVAVTPGSVTLVWNEQSAPAQTRARVVGVATSGAIVSDASPVLVDPQLLGSFSGIVPVTDGNTTWLHWTLQRPTAMQGIYSPDPQGLMLAAGQPVGDAASASLLATVDPTFVDWQRGPTAAEGHLFATGGTVGQVFATDGPVPHMTYADYVAGAGPLSGTITKSASYRVPVVNAPYGVDPIVFSDRVLILSDVGASGMRPTVIFR